MKKDQSTEKSYEKWIDYIKVIACVFVVMGHFFQSMQKSNIVAENQTFEWLHSAIYSFHVPLFFICSGYLYQKKTVITSLEQWMKMVGKKLLVLGIPFFTFTTITWTLKMIFEKQVNMQTESLIRLLFIHPTAPYWYLYVLFFLFCVIPVCQKRYGTFIELFIAVILFFIGNITSIKGILPYPIVGICDYGIWFILGMVICKVTLKSWILKKRKLSCLASIVFFVGFVAILCFVYKDRSTVMRLILGLLSCISIIIVIVMITDKVKKISLLDFLPRYTLPIFLMHTLFAAPIRVILLRIGITNSWIHIIVGLAFSFIGPIVAAMIMSKVKLLNFFLYPLKVINDGKKERNTQDNPV